MYTGTDQNLCEARNVAELLLFRVLLFRHCGIYNTGVKYREKEVLNAKEALYALKFWWSLLHSYLFRYHYCYYTGYLAVTIVIMFRLVAGMSIEDAVSGSCQTIGQWNNVTAISYSQ